MKLSMVRFKNNLSVGEDDPWDKTEIAGTHGVLRVEYAGKEFNFRVSDRKYCRQVDEAIRAVIRGHEWIISKST